MGAGMKVRFGEKVEGWKNFTKAQIKVVGVQHRKRAAIEFAEGCARAEATGREAWVTLEPEPENPFDRHAVKVIGHWIRRGIFRKSAEARHIGYLPSDIAEEAAELVANGSMRARLMSVYSSDNGFIDVSIIPIVPR